MIKCSIQNSYLISISGYHAGKLLCESHRGFPAQGPPRTTGAPNSKLNPHLNLVDQIFTSLAVSTGCLSYGICMAYTSSAIPSMLDPNSSLTITYSEASWMSSLLALGAMFGSLSAVFLMDAVGRKASLLAFSSLPPLSPLSPLSPLLSSSPDHHDHHQVGRKASLLAFSVMSLFIGWTMMMAASQAWQLYVGRFSSCSSSPSSPAWL